MKNYKKAALATMVLAAMPLLAATSNTAIKVTTFVDEDNVNPNACSLREAIKAAEKRISYGGCTVTDISPASTKLIQLEAGTYFLNKELIPNVRVSILGASPLDGEKKDVLTNRYPAQTELKTTIDAQNNSRIFNTTQGKTYLALTNIVLKGGKTSERGGAIYAGGDINLQNTRILNSESAQEGGAIFLAGPASSLTMNHSLIQGSQAPKSSVLGMTCLDDDGYAKHPIDINGSSFVNNGSANSSSIFEICGDSESKFTTNTIAKNITNTINGSIIKFTGDTLAGTEINTKPSILSNNSKLELTTNTIVENTAKSTFLYDKLGDKELNFNVLAYNVGGYTCRYLLGEVADQKLVGLLLNNNAFALSGASKCDLPTEALPANNNNIDISSINDVRTLLTPLQPASEYTAFLPLYYPVDNGSNLDLVNASISGDLCGAVDQRGILRNTSGTLYFEPTANNTCDIGSVELMKLTAKDISDLSNQSLTVNLVDKYQKQIDNLEDLIKNPDDPNFIVSDKEQLALYKNLLEKTKANLHYRALYIDLKNVYVPLPEEITQTDGSHKLQFFSKDLYTVTTEPLGRGQINDAVSNIDTEDKQNLVCEWNADLEQIIFYRKDDLITQAGDKIFCKYTIQSINNPAIKSSGLIQAAFGNIKPEAENASLTFKYQKHEKKILNLLDFANDEGDTGEGGSGPVNQPNKPQFWKNADGVELPIRLIDVPDRNLIVTADRQGPCPEPDQEETCYGGNIYVQEANTFNPFNFSFKYKVYDADGLASDEATVNTISTATTTDDTRNASGGSGGGSINILGLFGLFGLLAYRRFKK